MWGEFMADISGYDNLYIALKCLKDALSNYKMCSYCGNEVKRIEQAIKILEGEND
jgi:hypothetical protein